MFEMSGKENSALIRETNKLGVSDETEEECQVSSWATRNIQDTGNDVHSHYLLSSSKYCMENIQPTNETSKQIVSRISTTNYPYAVFNPISPDVILCGWLGLKHQLTN